jgi:hypothetical protein
VSADAAVVRSRWRARLVRGFFVAVLAAQAALLVRGYGDPHHFFAFQPFNDSDTWRAEIYRVTASGERATVDDGTWFGYSWDELVDVPQLRSPGRLRHASTSAASTIDFLDEALDWVARHTPRDTETRYLEAEVTWFHNTRGPYSTTLRSAEREGAG